MDVFDGGVDCRLKLDSTRNSLVSSFFPMYVLIICSSELRTPDALWPKMFLYVKITKSSRQVESALFMQKEEIPITLQTVFSLVATRVCRTM